MNSVFISGSIALKGIPYTVEQSIKELIDQGTEILVGDAKGVDTAIQNYCKRLGYSNVTVYSIYPVPRYRVPEFKAKHILVNSELRTVRERQTVKDAAMTADCDYSLVIWDGKSRGSYQNIIRTIKSGKKVKVFLQPENRYLEHSKITSDEIEFIYRNNNDYTAKRLNH